jgi:hypothetical protein
MNTKYTQMNNFLVDIQTTQITVNNQILRHYNDNYSDLIESKIEKNVAQKLLDKNVVSAEVIDTDDDVAGSKIEENNNNEDNIEDNVLPETHEEDGSETKNTETDKNKVEKNKAKKIMKIDDNDDNDDNDKAVANVTFNIQ